MKNAASLPVYIVFCLSGCQQDYTIQQAVSGTQAAKSGVPTVSAPGNSAASSLSVTSVSSDGMLARVHGTSFLLDDGRVFTAGGWDGAILASPPQIYDLSKRTWTSHNSGLSSDLLMGFTLLKDGRVLAVGGANYDARKGFVPDEGCPTYIYDSKLDVWSSVSPFPGGGLTSPALITLPDGRVAMFGGRKADLTFSTRVSVYDPSTNSWTTGPDASAQLESGAYFNQVSNFSPIAGTTNILAVYSYAIVGEASQIRNRSLVFDAKRLRWSADGPALFPDGLILESSIVPMPDGQVVLIGSILTSVENRWINEIYDPSARTWTAGATPHGLPPRRSVSIALPGRRIWIGGGFSQVDRSTLAATDRAQIYDLYADSFVDTPSLASARYDHSAVALAGGSQLLVTGGFSAFVQSSSTNALKSALLINVGTP